ncbi:MAG: Ig-like domain-containing protein [Acidobacteriota bacterium]
MKLQRSLKITHKIMLFLIFVSTVTVGFGYLGNGPIRRMLVIGEASAAADRSELRSASLVLAATTTAITSDINPSVVGQTITFTATITVTPPGSGTVTGTVAFQDGGNTLGRCDSQPVSAGQATCQFPASVAGNLQITAIYSGDGNFGTSTSAVYRQTVNPAATSTVLTSNNNPSTLGQNVTFTAFINVTPPGGGVPVGTVAFQDNGTDIPACNFQSVSSNQATCSISSLSSGTHSITAVYSGDGNFLGSTSNTVSQVVSGTSTTTGLASNVNPSNAGQSVTFTATISITPPGTGTPTGTVQFQDNGINLPSCASQSVSSGQATCTISTLSPGSHPITAVYIGDGNFLGSTSNTVNQVINGPSTTTSLASSVNPSNVGQNVTFTATISVTPPGTGTPTGSVHFQDVGVDIPSCASQAVSSGQATCTISTLSLGSHSITAVYSGDGNFAGSTSNTVTQVVSEGAPLPPTASVNLNNVNGPGGTIYSFTVTYSDDTAINVSTLDSSDIVITGPNAFSTPATFVSVNDPTNGTPRIATYSFVPPGGSWDGSDVGTYTVSMVANQVADTSGSFVNAGVLGTFSVSTGDLVVDRTDDSPAANACTAAPNDCSLRGAISSANISPGPDNITFDSAVFATPQTITLGGSEIVIANSGGLQINGPGAKLVTISGNNASRIFTNSPGAITSISGLRLTGGTGTGTAGTGRGGAVYNNGGQLTLGGLIITGNTSTNGAGLSNATTGAVLNIISCWINGNTTPGSGGGLQNFSGVTTNIVNTSITGNTANSSSTGGGAIQANGTVTVTNSTIGGNSAPNSSAGGIYYNGASLTITNSTISGNSSLNNGGGVHSTSATPAAIRNSIIAGNHGNAASTDMTGIAGSLGNNIVGVVGTSGGWVDSDLQNTDPLLAPLGYYGGNGFTFAPTSASPAINAGQACVTDLSCSSTNPPFGLTVDERGASRIGTVDIGAVELNNSANGGTYIANLPNGLQGTAYSYLLVPANGAFSQSVAAGSLPAGIALNGGASTTIAGTPTVSGQFSFSLASSGGGNTNVTDYHILVMAPAGTLTSIQGRVLMPNGQPPAATRLVISDAAFLKRGTITSPFGYYQFNNLPAGKTYTIAIISDRYTMTPVTFDLNYSLTNLDLTVIPNP